MYRDDTYKESTQDYKNQRFEEEVYEQMGAIITGAIEKVPSLNESFCEQFIGILARACEAGDSEAENLAKQLGLEDIELICAAGNVKGYIDWMQDNADMRRGEE